MFGGFALAAVAVFAAAPIEIPPRLERPGLDPSVMRFTFDEAREMAYLTRDYTPEAIAGRIILPGKNLLYHWFTWLRYQGDEVDAYVVDAQHAAFDRAILVDVLEACTRVQLAELANIHTKARYATGEELEISCWVRGTGTLSAYIVERRLTFDYLSQPDPNRRLFDSEPVRFATDAWQRIAFTATVTEAVSTTVKIGLFLGAEKGRFLIGGIEVRTKNGAAVEPVPSIYAKPFVAYPSAGTRFAHPAQASVVRPKVLGIVEHPEMPNPARGLHRWRRNEYAPIEVFEDYDRYEWKHLERAEGDYDFSSIDRDIAAAAAKGRRFAFRVRCFSPKQGNDCPDYIVATGQGWWTARKEYVPDWNDPYFMSRQLALIEALGARYNDDPRISWVDVGSYGRHGEWHMMGYTYPGPRGEEVLTYDNARRIMQAYIRAFANKQLLMRANNDYYLFALKQSPRIGLRDDGVGRYDSVRNTEVRFAQPELWEIVRERWKTAPFGGETQFQQGVSALFIPFAVWHLHYSVLGNGNVFPKWSDLTPPMQEAFLFGAKLMGYRYVIQEVALPRSVRAGEAFSVHAYWANQAVAPIYDPWQVEYVVRRAGEAPIVARSALNLSTLASHEDGYVLVSDSLRLPAGIAAGEYRVAVRVRDLRGFYPHLRLAMEGRSREGEYPVGTLTVVPALSGEKP